MLVTFKTIANALAANMAVAAPDARRGWQKRKQQVTRIYPPPFGSDALIKLTNGGDTERAHLPILLSD
jgi:hypothetical protein